jgi:hypothetical protein
MSKSHDRLTSADLERRGIIQRSESVLRRRARAQGLRLTKLRENSRWFAQYGPYMLADLSTNVLIAYGIADLATVQRELAERQED